MRFKIILSSLGFLVVLFIVVPLFKLLVASDPAALVETAADAEVHASIFLTLRASLWATIAALFTGIPLAWVLARSDFPGRRIVEGIIDLPVMIPHTAAGIALLNVWGRNSVFSKATGLNLIGTEAAISIAMFFVSVPFLVNAVKDGFKLIDERYEKTAVSLGATPWEAFRTVSLPMVKKSIVSGSIMMWGRGISEFGAVVILAYHPMVTPVLIFERFQNFGLKYALPVAGLLMIVSLAVFIIVRLFEGKGKGKEK
ncbi:MAG: ABC transporter permease [bacterium]|nr:ABC transporter permease [bacterium]